MEVPESAYYGIQTPRALCNFPVSGHRARSEFVRAYIQVKKAAALANMELGGLDRERGNAIVAAAEEVLSGLNGGIRISSLWMCFRQEPVLPLI